MIFEYWAIRCPAKRPNNFKISNLLSQILINYILALYSCQKIEPTSNLMQVRKTLR